MAYFDEAPKDGDVFYAIVYGRKVQSWFDVRSNRYNTIGDITSHPTARRRYFGPFRQHAHTPWEYNRMLSDVSNFVYAERQDGKTVTMCPD